MSSNRGEKVERKTEEGNVGADVLIVNERNEMPAKMLPLSDGLTGEGSRLKKNGAEFPETFVGRRPDAKEWFER